jgi:hypothetical protein
MIAVNRQAPKALHQQIYDAYRAAIPSDLVERFHAIRPVMDPSPHASIRKCSRTLFGKAILRATSEECGFTTAS